MQDFLSEIEKHMDEMERQNEEIRLETRYLYQKQQDQEEVIVEKYTINYKCHYVLKKYLCPFFS
jgi:vacuolar-type H+-ATPase subunit I/STV1